MEKSVRSGLGALVQTAQKFDKPLTILANSTLNQKFGVFDTTLPGSDEMPTTKYVAIGIGGHRTEIGISGLTKFVTIQHTPENCGLYKHIPFILRLPNQDLTVAERVKYRMRTLETHGGVSYVAYYLRVLDLSAVTPRLELRTVADGIVTSTPWEPTVADLNPTPPAVSSGQTLTTGNDYLAASCKVPFVLTPADIQELLNVVNIIYGDEGYAIISEMALCSGVDKVVTGDFNGTAVAYTEAIGVQVNDFLATLIPAVFQVNGTTIDLDAGSVEPLLQLT